METVTGKSFQGRKILVLKIICKEGFSRKRGGWQRHEGKCVLTVGSMLTESPKTTQEKVKKNRTPEKRG